MSSSSEPMSTGKDHFLGHPKMLWVLLAVTVGSDLAFYGFRAFLAPYVADTFFRNIPGNQAIQQAELMFAGFGTLLYATPIIGGWVADNVLGKVRSLRLALWMQVAGLFAMAIPTKLGLTMGLAFFAISAGLAIPLTVLVGLNYQKDDPKRDAGYTLYYLAINFGAFLAPFIISEWIARDYGYSWAFLAAAITQIIIAIIFELGLHHMPNNGEKGKYYRKYTGILVIVACLILTYPFAWLLSHALVVRYIMYTLMALLVLYFVVKSIERHDRTQSNRYIALLILFVALVVFWSWSMLSATALNFFARDFVGPMWKGSLPIVGTWGYQLFQSANPLYILIAAVPISLLWPWLDKHKINPSTPAKFGIGVVLVSISYGVLVLADKYGMGSDGKIAAGMLALSYAFSTVGELALSPIGYALIGNLAAPEDVSLAMGGWFFGVAVASNISGYIATLTSQSTKAGIDSYTHVFALLFWIGLVIGIAYLLFSKMISKLMRL